VPKITQSFRAKALSNQSNKKTRKQRREMIPSMQTTPLCNVKRKVKMKVFSIINRLKIRLKTRLKLMKMTS